MRIAIINKSDSTGGAAVVSRRLMEALRRQGVDARMIVAEKLSDSPYVAKAAGNFLIQSAFLRERLEIFLKNGLDRSTLFKIDTASAGLRLDRHPWVREADVICLNWVNQGLLSLRDIRCLGRLGKPIVWTMHDMWNFTGICHHAGDCTKYMAPGTCGDCPLMGGLKSRHDLSYRTLRRKQLCYARTPITFVAVSRWLADCGRRSTLLKDNAPVVIPNAFPISERDIFMHPLRDDEEFRILFGAARLDDTVKGLPILVETTKILKNKYPELAAKTRLITFGTAKDPSALEGIVVERTDLGRIDGAEALCKVYIDADCVVSTSLFETLPGTLIEGQAYGCVPVSFLRGGQADIIDHLNTGYLADWSDDLPTAAERIADGLAWAAQQCADKTRHQDIIDRMRASVIDRFSEEAVARRYIDLFQELTKQ